MQEPVYEWMDYASKKIQGRLKPNIDIDDWMWGKDCFQFVLILNASSMEKAYATDPYAFYYHEGEGTAHQQIDDWIENNLYRFFKEVNMYEIVKDVVSVIKNYHGYPGVGKETRWYITYNGERIKDIYNENAPLWFYRKKDAKAYIEEVLT